jgi:gliding motility-associated-like protein
MNRSLVLLFAASWCLSAGRVAGQCSGTISTFPYQEGFEASAAWTSGGFGDDWAWGTPAKPTISGPGGGTKSWCVGGLTGSFYNIDAQSWLESPCFDFTALPYPWISFKLFWECERTYDGFGFQYSLDQGTTWSNVGSVNDPVTCFDQNWFNAASILNLDQATPNSGWSGRIGPTQGSCTGGAGSGGWLTASHCLVDLAGEPSVKFRFIFGAGSTCNNYDGVAVDDIFIGEAPPEQNPVQFSCFADTLSINGLQTCADSWLWDFDDPASGSANTSTDDNPEHVFTAPGSYNVTLTLNFSCRSPQVVPLPLNILGLQVLTTDPDCSGNNGSVEAIISNAQGPLTYTWNPGGYTTSFVSGLGAGNYVVLATDGGICPTGAIVTLEAPPNAPTLTVQSADATCSGDADGSATVTVNGGTPGFTYVWAPSGGNASSANGLAAGAYTCTVTDAAQCTVGIAVDIAEPAPLVVTAQDDAAICDGDAITLTATAIGGTGAYTFSWFPDGPAVSPAVATTYSISATDANGCGSNTDDVIVNVGSVATPAFTVADSLGCSPHCTAFSTTVPFDAVAVWDFGDGVQGDGTDPVHCFAQAGTYDVTLTITSPDGCNGSYTLVQAVEALPSPIASFTASPLVATIEDPSTQFLDRSSGAEQWLWSFGDPEDSTSTVASPEFTYPDVGCYTVLLRVSNAYACADSVSGIFCVEDEFAAYVPNAFTPNDDGFNDAWGVSTTVGDPVVFELFVFDRWGGLLFEAANKNDSWTGDGIPQGVYPWRLRLIDSKGFQQVRTGHVTLLR